MRQNLRAVRFTVLRSPLLACCALRTLASLTTATAKMDTAHGGSFQLPTLYLHHGSAKFFSEAPPGDPFESLSSKSPIAASLRGLQNHSHVASWFPSVKAIVIVSAHWEENAVTVQTSAAPPMYYDFHGFPEECYQVQYSAPGAPELAKQIQTLLTAAGIRAAGDANRGYDHGAYVPLKLAIPEASIPTIQLSLHSSLDPAMHLKIGAALAPLREQGVLIIGSGSPTHNLRELRVDGRVPDWVREFSSWLDETMMGVTPEERVRRLATVAASAPHFRRAHPREEHFIPLHVAVGAAAPEAVQAVLGKGKGNATAAADVAADGTATTPTHSAKVLHTGIVLGTFLCTSFVIQ